MNTLRNQQLTAAYLRVYSAAVEWKVMREEFRELFKKAKERGETQMSVAARGGLKQQNSISKLLRNRNLGPQAEVFIRAIEGLGIRPSDFFLRVQEKIHAVTSPVSIVSDKRTPTLGEVDVHDQSYGPAVSANAADVERRIRFLEQAIERLHAERDAAHRAESRAVHGARRKKPVRRPSHS